MPQAGRQISWQQLQYLDIENGSKCSHLGTAHLNKQLISFFFKFFIYFETTPDVYHMIYVRMVFANISLYVVVVPIGFIGKNRTVPGISKIYGTGKKSERGFPEMLLLSLRWNPENIYPRTISTIKDLPPRFITAVCWRWQMARLSADPSRVAGNLRIYGQSLRCLVTSTRSGTF